MAIVDFSGGSQPGSGGGGGGGGDVENAVLYTAQSLSSSQKLQARTNIGAGTYSKPSGGIPASDLASGVAPGTLVLLQVPSAGTYTRSNFESTYCTIAELLKVVDGLYRFASVDYDNGASVITKELPVCGSSIDTMGETDCTVSILEGSVSVNISFNQDDGDITVSRVAVTAYNIAEWNAKYDKPSGGIPSSDMASAVQTSLGKADAAYQKPSGGIPDSDLAAGVIPAAVEANPVIPSGTTPTDLTNLKVGDSYYAIPQGGGGGGGGSTENAVLYSAQSLNSTQQAQARTNIGAGTYSKPAGGIPAADLASGVIPTVAALTNNEIDTIWTTAMS